MNLAFQLGHQPHISTAEIQAVFSALLITFTRQHDNTTTRGGSFFIVEISEDIDIKSLMQRLGGTIKIMEKVEVEGKTIVNKISTHLDSALSTGKVHFSLSGSNAKKIALEVKKKLKSEGRSVRYIEPKNTATILHNKLVVKQTDLTIIDGDIYVTRAIQPIEEFSNRDFGRPGRDDKSGMLPPKLARIMINLSQAKTSNTVLDPFCGSGTILMEALLMGFENVLGSDISPKAIEHTKQNLEWLLDNNKITTLQPASPHLIGGQAAGRHDNTTVRQLDVRHLGKKFESASIDAIIFEPYMGKPLTGKETKQQLESQAKELSTLYKETFQSLHKILKPNGIVTCIIPKFRYKDEWITVNCLEHIKKAGFKINPLSNNSNSLLYHRKKQYVGREIWQFKV